MQDVHLTGPFHLTALQYLQYRDLGILNILQLESFFSNINFKMKIITVLILGFISGLLFSNTLKAQNDINQDVNKIKETITIRSIKNWLYQTAEKVNGSKKKFILNIASNLNDNNLSVCNFNERTDTSHKLVTIPLTGIPFSSNISKDSVADQIFVIGKDANGFGSAQLVLIYPKNKMHKSIQISCNDIEKLYHSNYFPVDGTVQLINLGDTLEAEYKYENNVSVEQSFLLREEFTATKFEKVPKEVKGYKYFWITYFNLSSGKIHECKVEKYTIYL